MYITINDVIGEKTIDLSYPIHSTTGRGEARKEIAVVSMHSSNSQILLHRSIEVLSITGKKILLNKGVYMDKELNSLIGMELKSQMLDSCNDVLRTNKLERIMKMIISLNELNNSNNLEDGRQQRLIYLLGTLLNEDLVIGRRLLLRHLIATSWKKESLYLIPTQMMKTATETCLGALSKWG